MPRGGLPEARFFDENANTRFDDAEASISVLKDMQTGKFSRGGQEFSAPCSIVLGGNIDTNLELRQPDGRCEHLFKPLPPELQDLAFLDRIHVYLAGWEIPKIRPENYATGYGLLTDYLAEIFAELRRLNFQTHLNARVKMGGMTGRNQDAVKKNSGGAPKASLPTPHARLAEIGRIGPAPGSRRGNAQTRHRPARRHPAEGILGGGLPLRTGGLNADQGRRGELGSIVGDVRHLSRFEFPG